MPFDLAINITTILVIAMAILPIAGIFIVDHKVKKSKSINK